MQATANAANTATWTLNGLTVGTEYQLVGDLAEQLHVRAGRRPLYCARQQRRGDRPGRGLSVQRLRHAADQRHRRRNVRGDHHLSVTVTLDDPHNASTLLDAGTVNLLTVGTDHGVDDDFHLQAGSPALDAGDPASQFLVEPNGGGRVNLGFDGNTTQALASAAQTLQVLSPAGLQKLTVGQATAINVQGFNLGTTQQVLLLNAGGSAIYTSTQGNWSADAYQASGTTMTNAAPATNTTVAPNSLFQSAATLNYGSGVGSQLSYELPAANGSYTLRLFFDETQTTAGNRKFNIVVNGVT